MTAAGWMNLDDRTALEAAIHTLVASLPDTPHVDWAAVEALTQRPRDQR